MEANLRKRGCTSVDDIIDIKCLKRHDSCMEEAQRPFLSRHVQPIQDCSFRCNGPEPLELKVGFIYEIDHKQLQPKSPIQVEGIRAVLVKEISEFNVTVRTPSIRSLRQYFSEMNAQKKEMGTNFRERTYPELDKQFVMGSKLAKEILVRQISPNEFNRQRHLQSFWLLPSKATGISTAIVNGDSKDETALKGVCWSYLNCPGFVRWGVRRKISYVEKAPRVPSLSSLIKEEEDSQIDIKPDIKTKDETKRNSRKRKHEGWKHSKKAKVVKCEVKKPSSNIQKLKICYGWWSQDRYKNAEVQMMRIMKAKGAVVGKPILRHALRMEARKHIGDTGLLDHVLKNMADKVAPNGEDRFRRRHNADGAMEYWLESADLVNIRREAGVKDPYWTPPPGWKPGDNPSQDSNFAWELKLLKEEISNIKKDVQVLHLLKREDEVDRATVISTKSSCESCNESDTKVVSLLEDYENLVKRKAQLEQQLAQIRKRNPEYRKHHRKPKEAKCEMKRPSSKNGEQKLKLSYGRWSQDRYASAEVKMMEIMKAKGAVYGKPMVRQALRMEARKHIGDTGLLDHILKHMADKVTPNGLDRFRRRHNADGAMEYWLESADLVNIRREAGVKDPYWTPPPGWKPGDNPSQEPNYARELKLLKEEMSNIEKDVQALLLLKREDKGNKAIGISTKSSSESCNVESDTTEVSFQEDYENLVNRKAQLAQQCAQISESSNGMQGTIASFLAGPRHPHGSATVDLNNFFRIHPCDFVTGQSLDTEPKESSFILLV